MAGRVWRLTRFELAKLFRQWFVYACFALTAGMTWLGIHFTSEEMEGFWKRTGFDYIVQGVSMALVLLPMMLLVIGSRSVSGEASGGTLRTVMTRPITRTDFILAKILSLVVLSLTLYLAMLLVAEGLAWHKADRFRALFPTYPVGGGREVPSQTPARTIAELLQESVRNLSLLYLPLLSAALFGLFVSVLFNNEGVSVSISALFFLPYLICAGVYPSAGSKGILPSKYAQWLAQYHLVTPLDKLRLYVEGYSHGYGWSGEELVRAIGVPLGYVVVLSAISLWVFRKRNILV